MKSIAPRLQLAIFGIWNLSLPQLRSLGTDRECEFSADAAWSNFFANGGLDPTKREKCLKSFNVGRPDHSALLAFLGFSGENTETLAHVMGFG
jgi:hypothetical protein